MEKEHFIGENRIHVTEYPPEQDMGFSPVVLVHGSFGAGWMWNGYVPALSQAGYAVSVLDLRGHGKSGGSLEGATMNDYVSDVFSVTDQLGLEAPIVIGHSMGGLVALMYASMQSVKSVVAIDPSPTLEVQQKSEVKTYPVAYTAMDAGLPADPMEVMKALPDLSKEMLMQMKSMLGAESGVARSERKKGISLPGEYIKVPTLFLAGELGGSVAFGIAPAMTKAMATQYGGDFIQISGATHPGMLMGEHASDAVTALIGWLTSRQ